jgi:hypothetical protein
LPSGEFDFTRSDLIKNFPAVTVDAVCADSPGEEIYTRAVGVKLEDILALHGASQKDYSAALTTASDGYAIEIPENILQTRDIVIAYEVNGKEERPRTVIPNERAMYWAKSLAKIELVEANELKKEDVTEALFLDTITAHMLDAAVDCKYFVDINKAFPVAAMLDRYARDKPRFVSYRSTDNLAKNEKYGTFAREYIMFTGDKNVIPMFTGPELPVGMRVKQLLSIQVGSANIVCFDLISRLADNPAVPVQTVLETARTVDAPSYTFKSDGGYSVTLGKADAMKGKITAGADALPRVEFDGLGRNTSVSRLLSVTAVPRAL